MKQYISLSLLLITSNSILFGKNNKQTKSPNIILVISDDQGYGDFSCHGNPWLKTPNIDKLHDEGIRLTDFHVSPTSSPTRSALMTGLYTNRAGAWHTIGGRSMVFDENIMFPQVLSENGYQTGLFGKWHLGDNHPFRPQDNGFKEVLMHGGGGVGQQPDYFGNDYFNDTYWHNGKPEKFKGYCTDVFFNQAFKFISNKASSEEPFFCYIATNAPHAPYHVADKYSKRFKGVNGIVSPAFYGMIENLDENMGKLYKVLNDRNIADNTILIFMTDNGSTGGLSLDKQSFLTKGFNAGMRGKKASPYEGGHRVPFFIKWPNGKIVGGKDINELTAHIDIFPTLVDMLNLKTKDKINTDGISLKELLTGTQKDLPKRTIMTDSQRDENCIKWKSTSVMQDKWRLINNKELYHIGNDPEQRNNVAAKHPAIVNELSSDYDSIWADISKGFNRLQNITLCSPSEPVTILNAMDLHVKKGANSIWNQEQEREFEKSLGWYAVHVPESGTYKLTLYRYAEESGYGLNDAAPASKLEIGTNVEPYKQGKVANIVKGFIKVDDKETSELPDKKSKGIVFVTKLEKGNHKLSAEFENIEGERFCAMHVKVEKLN